MEDDKTLEQLREYNNLEKMLKQYYNHTGHLQEMNDLWEVDPVYGNEPFAMDLSLFLTRLEKETRQLELCEEVFLTAESDVI